MLNDFLRRMNVHEPDRLSLVKLANDIGRVNSVQRALAISDKLRPNLCEECLFNALERVIERVHARAKFIEFIESLTTKFKKLRL